MHAQHATQHPSRFYHGQLFVPHVARVMNVYKRECARITAIIQEAGNVSRRVTGCSIPLPITSLEDGEHAETSDTILTAYQLLDNATS
jgi:hypothetical protein